MLFFRYLANEVLRIGTPEEKEVFGDLVYMGKELLFSIPYAYRVPKASILKVSSV